MTFSELDALICEILPNASMGEDEEGQLIIYTNLREIKDQEELEELT